MMGTLVWGYLYLYGALHSMVGCTITLRGLGFHMAHGEEFARGALFWEDIRTVALTGAFGLERRCGRFLIPSELTPVAAAETRWLSLLERAGTHGLCNDAN